jgi:hypothetical protein
MVRIKPYPNLSLSGLARPTWHGNDGNHGIIPAKSGVEEKSALAIPTCQTGGYSRILAP